MDEVWKQLPRAAVIVCASVLGSGSARAQEPEPAPESDASAQPDPALVPVAPTCGPSCHGGAEVNEEIQPPPDEDNLPIAPTCGPSCHGGYEPEIMPPPVEPPPKKGCAVEDVDDAEPLGLAVLGLGLLVGAATRRRPES